MSVTMTRFETPEEWRMARKSHIGGSDAACILGLNPWKSNTELWEEKRGIRGPENLDDNPLVLYGKRAEEHQRELFRLDYPELTVLYEPDNMWYNTKYPWAHASLDGWLVRRKSPHRGVEMGILEIKTATISGQAQKAKWADGIPQNYYVQILHYLMVTEAEFAILRAQLKYEIPDKERFAHIQHYRIERKDVEDDIAYLIEKEREFSETLSQPTPPARILPEI